MKILASMIFYKNESFWLSTKKELNNFSESKHRMKPNHNWTLSQLALTVAIIQVDYSKPIVQLH